MTEIRILIADDHEMMRHGVRTVLESKPGMRVCGEASNGREAVAKSLALKPDVVILDVSMPLLNGLEAARQIHKALPRAEILIFTMHESEQLVYEAMSAGARGYVLKTDANPTLVSAVETVAKHKPFFTSKVSDLMLKNLQEPRARESGSMPLTRREREILQLVAEGKTSRQIATLLSISVKTADTHRANLMRKLDLHSVSELVRYAIRNKVISP
jgi:DNA-binding NarL/FixJ family response regulator